MKNNFFIILLCLLIAPILLLSQDANQAHRSYQKKINFDGQALDTTIQILVVPDSRQFSLFVEGKIEAGDVSLTLLDANDKKISRIQLKAGPGRMAKGTMGKENWGPSGIYYLKIKNDTASGYFSIDFSQRR